MEFEYVRTRTVVIFENANQRERYYSDLHHRTDLHSMKDNVVRFKNGDIHQVLIANGRSDFMHIVERLRGRMIDSIYLPMHFELSTDQEDMIISVLRASQLRKEFQIQRMVGY